MTAARVIGRAVRAVRAGGSERVLVHVIAVHVMKMTIVKIVRVAVMLHRRVPAGRSMRVRVAVVLVAVLRHLPTPFASGEMAANR
jgi:hypothetical protein